MQMLIDASVKGLKSLAYTKDTDYAEIFASTGQAINVSCFAKWDAESGAFVEDNRQGANWAKTQSLRKQYRNVGAVMVATNDAMVEWALKQDWVDVVIPYHICKCQFHSFYYLPFMLFPKDKCGCLGHTYNQGTLKQCQG